MHAPLRVTIYLSFTYATSRHFVVIYYLRSIDASSSPNQSSVFRVRILESSVPDQCRDLSFYRKSCTGEPVAGVMLPLNERACFRQPESSSCAIEFAN